MSRLIVKNIPPFITEKELKSFFQKKGQLTQCTIKKTKQNKSRRFAFIGYRQQSAALQAQKFLNNTYIYTSKISVELAKTKDNLNLKRKGIPIKESLCKPPIKKEKRQQIDKKFQLFKNQLEQKSKQSWNDIIVPEKKQQQKQNKNFEKKSIKKGSLKPVIKKETLQILKKVSQKPLQVDKNRLYVTNFPYNIEQKDIQNLFKKYGQVKQIKLPKDQQGNLKGYGFVNYFMEQQAMRAYYQLDNKIVFGRIMHLSPSLQDVGKVISSKKQANYNKKIIQQKSSFKKQKKQKLLQRLQDTSSWNSLFLNPNTIIQTVAKKFNLSKVIIFYKTEILSDQVQQLPAKLAIAQAEIIEQTKEWLRSKGINLDFLEKNRKSYSRSKRVLLVKNLPFNCSRIGLQRLLSYYGQVNKLYLCPNKSIGIAEFSSQQFCKNAFRQLQHYVYKDSPLYLEYAPVDMLQQQEQMDHNQQVNQEQLSKCLYIKNLNFVTTQDDLALHFKSFQPIKITVIKDKEGNSIGYGFIEFKSKEQVQQALKKMQHFILQNHSIQLSISRPRKKQIINKKRKTIHYQPKVPKIIIRNVPFQATKKDLMELFQSYGELKSVRLPKKMEGGHRGFGFVQYGEMQNAQRAYVNLGNVHLYGRKLVLQWSDVFQSQSK